MRDPPKTDSTRILAVVEELVPRVQDDDLAARRGAVRALGELGAVTDSVVPALATALGDSDEGVVLRAARGLARIGPSATYALPALLEMGRNRKFRRTAIRAIASICDGVERLLSVGAGLFMRDEELYELLSKQIQSVYDSLVNPRDHGTTEILDACARYGSCRTDRRYDLFGSAVIHVLSVAFKRWPQSDLPYTRWQLKKLDRAVQDLVLPLVVSKEVGAVRENGILWFPGTSTAIFSAIGSRAVPALVEMLRNGVHEYQADAIGALGIIGVSDATTADAMRKAFDRHEARYRRERLRESPFDYSRVVGDPSFCLVTFRAIQRIRLAFPNFDEKFARERARDSDPGPSGIEWLHILAAVVGSIRRPCTCRRASDRRFWYPSIFRGPDPWDPLNPKGWEGCLQPDQLLAGLKSDTVRARRNVACALAMLSLYGSFTRKQCALVIASPEMFSALHDEDEHVRRWSVQTVLFSGWATRDITLALVRALTDSSELVRESATEGLRRLAELANRHLLADFVKQLRKWPNHKKTSRKTEHFSDMAGEVLTALLSPLRNPQERVRKYAIDVLSKQRVIDHVVRLRHGPLLQRLTDAMTDSDAYVRWKAVRAVSPYASSEVFIRPFIRAMEDGDPRVREAAVRAACPDVSNGDLIHPLVRALEDDDLRVRQASGCVLRRTGLVRVILRLVFRARDRQLYIRVLRAWGRSARRDGASLKAKNGRSASRRS